MTETRTPRLNLPQWSSGSDSPSRTDFTDAFADLDARAAIDRRTPDPALPTGSPALVSAEYFQRTLTVGSDTLRALYRTDGGATWRAQSWIPERLRVRPADTVAATAEGFRLDHPDNAVAGLSATWEGVLTARRALILGSAAEPTQGRLSVGNLDAVPASVRARITAMGAERALEIKAGDANVTELLRMIDSAGSNVLTVSGAGQLTSTQGAAFGGISPSSAAALTVAPQASGSINTGLLGYGQETAPTRTIWQVNRYQPGGSDVASIFSIAPSLITIGRATAAWTGSQLDIGAVTTRLVTGRLAWFPDYTTLSGSGTFSPFPGLTGFAGIDATNGVSSTIGTQFNNFGSPTRDASRFASYNSGPATWTGDILRGYQAEIISGAPDAVLVARIDPVGRISANAPWLGSGGKPNQLRDVRQGLVHQCKKTWAAPGVDTGLAVSSNSAVTYTWPTMTVRSSSITQLDVTCRIAMQFYRTSGSIDRQVVQVRWYYQIAGGSWNLADPDPQESASLTVGSSTVGNGQQDTWNVTVPITAAAGTTFRMQMVVSLGPYSSDAKLRRADLSVKEAIVQTYAPSE